MVLALCRNGLRSVWGRRVIGFCLAAGASHPDFFDALPAGFLSPPSATQSSAAAPELGTATVLDGDTLRLADGERVRLLGVDTPEVGQPFADEATAFARAHIAGQPLRLVPNTGERDRYGRILADVWVDRGSLSEALVEAGLAWVYRAGGPRLISLQAEAVENARGVHGWATRVGGGPYRPTKTSFHHPACRLPGDSRTLLPLEQNPGCLFKMGLSPCRRCLPWPPASTLFDVFREGTPAARNRE